MQLNWPEANGPEAEAQDCLVTARAEGVNMATCLSSPSGNSHGQKYIVVILWT